MLRRTLYNAQRRAVEAGRHFRSAFGAANSDLLGWERVIFGTPHPQHGEQHVLPCHDLRPHEETRSCWCYPTESEPGVWGHYALDDRQLVEWGERRVQ